MSNILKPDSTYVKIILHLCEEEILTRNSMAEIVEPNFPYIPRPEKFKLVLITADKYAKNLEKNGFAIRASYKGRDYTLRITEKGKEYTEKLRKGERNERS